MNDPQAIATLLLETPQSLCADCIVVKTKISPGEVKVAFQRLASHLRVVIRQSRCAACSRLTMVFALTRSPFVLGDLVGSDGRPDLVGEVIEISRLQDGYVTVRWRTASGTSIHESVDERADALFVLPPLKGGAAA